MKHFLTSAGLLALGAAALHAYDPEMTRQKTGRPWSVAATVRGFYDDNVATSIDGREKDSFGFEVTPSAHLNLPMEQTFISLGYAYTFRWYDDRDPNDTDQAHEFNGKLRHQFSPRHDLGIDDTFVLTSEPSIVDRGNIITAPTRLRTKADVMHNRGAIEDNIGLTQQIGLSLGYVNNWYDYEQENVDILGVFGSRSALLDRMEHLFRIDARYTINPSLVALIGYNFGINDYTGDDFITGPFVDAFGIPRAGLKSDIRDNYTHFLYVGADYDITSKLRTSIRVGGQYTDYHESGDSTINPFADASASYVYLPGSSVQVGVRHTRNATDVAQVDLKGKPTLDAETTVIYGEWTHQILPKLTGSLMAQYQMSTFNDGAYDGKSENLFLVGANLEYHINRHWSAEIGYNYDVLDSDVQGVVAPGVVDDTRSYDRNRAYIGVRASY
jgi:hypothetical protein